MKRHIFLRDGQLWLINGEVPQKPEPLEMTRDIASVGATPWSQEWEKYTSAIERLKKEAIRIQNKDEVMAMRNMRECGDWVRSEDLPKEGKIYEIECEVEIKKHEICSICGARDSEPCEDKSGEAVTFCNCDLPMAILKPLQQEPVCSTCGKSENEFCSNSFHFILPDQDEIWDEFYNLRSDQIKRGLSYEDSVNEYKSKFIITRK